MKWEAEADDNQVPQGRCLPASGGNEESIVPKIPHLLNTSNVFLGLIRFWPYVTNTF